MIFVKWIGIVAVSVACMYLSMWLGGGWGEWLASAVPSRMKLLVTLLLAAGAARAYILSTKVMLGYEFFWDWLPVVVLCTIGAFVFGGIADPLVTYGRWPWQWQTWWTVILLPSMIWMFVQFYNDFRFDLEWKRTSMLDSESPG